VQYLGHDHIDVGLRRRRRRAMFTQTSSVTAVRRRTHVDVQLVVVGQQGGQSHHTTTTPRRGLRSTAFQQTRRQRVQLVAVRGRLLRQPFRHRRQVALHFRSGHPVSDGLLLPAPALRRRHRRRVRRRRPDAQRPLFHVHFRSRASRKHHGASRRHGAFHNRRAATGRCRRGCSTINIHATSFDISSCSTSRARPHSAAVVPARHGLSLRLAASRCHRSVVDADKRRRETYRRAYNKPTRSHLRRSSSYDFRVRGDASLAR